ncbi:MAG: alpha/beta hydrolase fold domain-containing protein [Saprospiraceae bacterium]|nr:alpha/beta hydrolase fold domain-containing protein [Saprospiraceae bacterium]
MGGTGAQPIDDLLTDTIGQVVRIDRYEDAQGYDVYLPAHRSPDSLDLVVFLHGYGALNPMIFGKWIEHLVVERQHCVVYPRYQMSLFQPSSQEFVPNTVEALHQFLKEARQHLPVRTESMYLVGHSYGGVIAANLSARYQQYGLPRPLAALICQPGTGPFNGGVMESYAEIDPDLYLAVMVGTNDQTVGQEFGRRIFVEARNTPNRMLIRHFPDNHQGREIDASHYEPYSIDERFDNGISNFTSNKARRVSRFDQLDVRGYWKMFDYLVDVARGAQAFNGSQEMLEDLGEWPDGQPVRKLEITMPEE